MDFEILGSKEFAGSSLSFVADAAMSGGFIKIFAAGELNAQTADRRLLIRINQEPNGYQGFSLMNGHAGGGEWDNSGIYMGRNGWGLDATFMFEATLAIIPSAQKITCAGTATFAHGNNTILGYECHGFLVTNNPVKKIDINFTGGVANGIAKFYRL